MNKYMCVYIYIYMCACEGSVCVCERERERERERVNIKTRIDQKVTSLTSKEWVKKDSFSLFFQYNTLWRQCILSNTVLALQSRKSSWSSTNSSTAYMTSIFLKIARMHVGFCCIEGRAITLNYKNIICLFSCFFFLIPKCTKCMSDGESWRWPKCSHRAMYEISKNHFFVLFSGDRYRAT